MKTILEEIIEKHRIGIDRGYIEQKKVVSLYNQVISLFQKLIRGDIGKDDTEKILLVNTFLLNQENSQGVVFEISDLDKCFSIAKEFDKQIDKGRIIKCNHIMDDITDFYEHGYNAGISTGFPNLDRLYRIAKRELNIVTGIPGHGKSEFIDQLLMNLSKSAGMKFAFFSPENFPYPIHIEKLTSKHNGFPFHELKNIYGEEVGKKRMSLESLGSSLNFINEHFCFLEPSENDITLDSILLLAKEAIEKNGIDGLVIDPWNEIEGGRKEGQSETDYIGESLMKLRRFARKNNICLWVIAHPRKLLKEKQSDGSMAYPVPTPYDISGSSHWYNKADNCLTVWRNADNSVTVHVKKIKFKIRGRTGTADFEYDKTTGIYTPKTPSEIREDM